MGLRAFVFGTRDALSLDSLRTRYAVIQNQLASAESQRQQAEAALVELRAAAARRGLAAALFELEHPPATAVVREAATTRVRALQSFSTEFQGLPVYAAPGDVLDVPDSLATRLAKGGLVERVNPATPLHQAVVRS